MNVTPKVNRKNRPFAGKRRQVLAEWRGMDFTPLETALANGTRPIKEVVSRVIDDMRLDRRRGEVEIIRAWNQLLDPNLTAHAQPANYHKGTLFVTVNNSVWLSEIVRYRRKEILDRMQHCFGKDYIVKISFRAG